MTEVAPAMDMEDDVAPSALSSSTSSSSSSSSSPSPDDLVGSPLLFSLALVCQSNVNRSMEAHAILQRQQWPISLHSYGVGGKVRLPGETAHTPNVYDFGTPYTTMIADLRSKNLKRYTANGILPMLIRDSLIKPAPIQWPSPHPSSPPLPHFALILTFEHRVFDVLVTSLCQRLSLQHRVCHVINLHTTDNTAEAEVSARQVAEWVGWLVERGEGWEDYLEESRQRFEAEFKRQLLHFTWWY